MTDFNYHEIDDVIHNIRTAIMAVLISVEEAELLSFVIK
jgi:hypothetical protein